jgi:hypothetical protein
MLKFLTNIFLSPQFWVIFIPAIVGIWIFSKTKAAERESEWRKEKLKIYLQFIQALSCITDSEINDEGEIFFAKSCNDMHALAPFRVLNALHKYQNEIRISNTNSTPATKQVTLNDLLYEIRRDLKIKPSDKKNEFEMHLWSSGKKKKENIH